MPREKLSSNATSELLIRRQDNVNPSDLNLSSHVNVAFEGGGTGGVIGLGMADVFEKEGLLSRANSFAGISIGADIANVVMSGQIRVTEKILIEKFSQEDLIKPWRALIREPIMDLGVLQQVLDETPLDTDALAADPRDIWFNVTNLQDFGPETISKNDEIGDPRKYKDLLMATVHLPRLAGKPPIINGIAYADGGLSTIDTAHIAISRLQATEPGKEVKVLNIASKAKTGYNYVDTVVANYFGGWIDKHGGPDAGKKYLRFGRLQAIILNSPDTQNIERIHPSGDVELPDLLCRDPELLRKGFVAGQNAAMRALGMTTSDQDPRPDRKQSLKSIVGQKALRTYMSLVP